MMGWRAGTGTALVLSGASGHEQVLASGIRPDHILGSVSEVVGLLDSD